MTKKDNLFFITIVFVAIFFVSCGRKNNNFLDFSHKKREPKFNRLSLPAIQKLIIKKDGDVVTLRWKKIQNAKYNVHRFIRTAFIPKKPVNKVPIKENYYTDKSNPPKNTCYLVRPVFYINGKTVIGPGSKIVCI
jgi:hypothetical protein